MKLEMESSDTLKSKIQGQRILRKYEENIIKWTPYSFKYSFFETKVGI